MKRINKNSLPYLLLSMLHVSLLLFTLIKKPERRTMTLLLSNISFAYIFEYFVFNVFRSYRYRPKILKTRQLDNAIGALLSQSVYVPVTATFLSIFRLGWGWKFFFIFYFHGIEYYFLKRKIYKLYWWKPFYTSLLLPIYFVCSDFWDSRLQLKKQWVMWLSTYLSVGVVTKTLAFILDIFKKQKIGLGRVHTWKEHFLISPLYMFIFSGAALLPAIKNTKSIKILTFIIMLTINYLLSLVKIINSKITFIQLILQSIFMIVLSPFLKSFIFKKQED
ncbi:hypothetical protein [Bacillus sp. SG-1]|uniref:hypothetical protein n=1 Tax=Bacillus sp. SG-1 TaxID=161544 RepID=UPI0002FFE9A2|nr:hypothetical protein [Bacillus sp. SG-1]